MADYRQFCGSCDAEIGFGSHKEGCEALARVRAAEQERRKFEAGVQEALRELSNEEVTEALVEYELRVAALSQEAAAMERYVRVLKQHAHTRDYSILEEARKRVKDRG